LGTGVVVAVVVAVVVRVVVSVDVTTAGWLVPPPHPQHAFVGPTPLTAYAVMGPHAGSQFGPDVPDVVHLFKSTNRGLKEIKGTAGVVVRKRGRLPWLLSAKRKIISRCVHTNDKSIDQQSEVLPLLSDGR
jgi:hypothetical protein